MKRTYFSIIILIFFIIISIIISQKGMVAGKSKIPVINAKINLEDSIIIKEFKMNSEEPLPDTYIDKIDDINSEGQIIYDNDFHNNIVEYNKIANKLIKRKKKKEKSSLIGKLKKKNSKWHLSKYIIKKNDNLWKIARKFNVNHRLIIDINNIKNPDTLKTGKYLNIPNKNGVYYIIKKGDTLNKIVKKFHTDVKKILQNNHIDKNKIYKGQKIFIPDAVYLAKKRKLSRKLKKIKKIKISKRKIRFIWPLRGKLTSGFGRRKDPFSGKKQFHCGIDIRANIGTKIKASASGRVIFSGWKKGYGKIVILRHKYGYFTVYAHNSRNLAKINVRVKTGSTIAYSGMTGAVTGAHLHFEIRKYVTPLNPLRLLK